MICYQDEKMYGPSVGTMTIQQIEDDIRRLEEKIYGENYLQEKPSAVTRKPMIYDVKSDQLVERKL